MVMDKSKVVDMLHKETVNITFTKVNGEEREMTCSLQESLLPPKKEGTTQRKENPDVLAVFDIVNEGWRSFRWDSLKTVNGEQYING
jgi:hypothetical protein